MAALAATAEASRYDGSPMSATESREPRPAGTVVVVRDGREGLELLLLQRKGKEHIWVFPGGRVDAADVRDPGDPPETSACRAAVREANEEAGLALAADELVMISRWITPEVSPRRFDTWFFLSQVGADADVRVDGSEMASHRWLGPEEALAEHHRKTWSLAPPTYVTVSWLAEYRTAGDAPAGLARGPILTIRPNIRPTGEGACILYPGDAGYESGDIEARGPRHRLWARRGDEWRYERRGEEG